MARAEGISFRTEQGYSNSDSSTQIRTTGEKIDTSFSVFRQLYDLDLSKTIYPYLNFDAGAVYELNRARSTTENIELDAEEKILRPFVELNVDSPVYDAGIAFRKRQREESTTNLPDTRDDRDEITALLGMEAQKWLPEWDLRFSHIHTYDDPETIWIRIIQPGKPFGSITVFLTGRQKTGWMILRPNGRTILEK
jgi:hypothetical protein